MENYIYLIIIFVVNILIIIVTRKHSTMVAGLDITLTGCFLSGYWLNFSSGVLISLLFMISSYVALIDITPTMLITIPVSFIVFICGTLTASTNIPIMVGVIIGLLLYSLISDLLIFKVFGTEDVFLIMFSDIKMFVSNILFFRIFW